MPHQATDDARH